MMVSCDNKTFVEAIVLCEYDGFYFAINKDSNCTYTYLYAKPLDSKVFITKEQIAKKFGVDINQLTILDK